MLNYVLLNYKSDYKFLLEVKGMDEAKEMEMQADDLKPVRKHFSRIGLMYFLGTIVIYAVQFLVAILVMALRPEWLEDVNISMAISMIPMYLMGMPILILLVKRVPAVKIEKHPMKPGHFVLAVIMTFAIMYISNIIGNIFTFIIGLLKGGAVENVLIDMISGLDLFWVFVYTVICAPIMEEYIFRKLIVDRTVRYGQGVAVLLSGFMFGLFHGNLNQFAYAFTLGMFLAFLYVKTGKLKITIAIHMMVNFMGGVASSLIMQMLDMEEYLRIGESRDLVAMTDFVMENSLAILMLLGFFAFAVSMIIAGGIMLVVFLVKKRFTLAPGEVTIPKGKRFQTVILNVGMSLFCLFWFGTIIWQMIS